MLHDRADPIDAGSRVLVLAIPQPPAQPLNLLDDYRLRRHPCRIIGRQAAGDLLQVLEPPGDMKPDMKPTRIGGPTTPASARMPRSPGTIDEGGHRRVLGSADGV
jgi:hypothetical protein